jgi:hypothetical protein
MDHNEAIRTKAVEQYLLGEMPAQLRDQFEEHFMSCQECARDLKAGVAFVESAKESFRQEIAASAAPIRKPEHRESWIAALFRPAIAAPALAVLVAVIAYQSLVTIPHMQSALSKAEEPSSIASFSLLSGSSRGEASVPVTVNRNEPFTLYVDVPPQPAFPLYTLDVQSASGAFEFSLPISAEQAKNTVEVFVPAEKLTPGDYAVVIRGAQSQGSGQGTEVGRSRFTLKYADQ